LAAAGLEVQVARANFYTSLNISAGVGYRAFNSGFPFSTPASLAYNAFGGVVAPLINRAAIKAAYMTANAEQLQAVYSYQRTVLNAFTEVMNYMSKVDKYGQSVETKKQQLTAIVDAYQALGGGMVRSYNSANSVNTTSVDSTSPAATSADKAAADKLP